MPFHFDPKTRRDLGYKLIDLLDDYFASLPDRPVQLPLDQRTFGELKDRMPEFGEDAVRVLDDATHELIDKGFHVPAANYFGLMNPTPTYMAVLAEALVAAINPQLATLARSQLASKIEGETIRWMAERIVNGRLANADSELPSPTGWNGTFTSGGNEANFTALALALAWKFPQVMEDGLLAIGRQPVAYASTESHHSLDKSVGLLGLGRKALRRVAVTERLQLDTRALEAQIAADLHAGLAPFCVVATAGTTNSGAMDDIAALRDICRRYNLWLHVDGAYGAALIFSNEHKRILAGIEDADSVTIDPHKWLAMPFAAGVVLTSHPELLESTFAIKTPYMPKVAAQHLIDNFKISTQWSRRMNSLKFWLTLRVHGRRAYEELIDRQLSQAASIADWVRGSLHFELAAPQVLPILNLRLKLPRDVQSSLSEDDYTRLHQAIVDEVTRDGQRWISLTYVSGRSVIRFMVISYLTEQRHIDALQAALTAAAEKVSRTLMDVDPTLSKLPHHEI